MVPAGKRHIALWLILGILLFAAYAPLLINLRQRPSRRRPV
jgi:hypothetical protein